MKAAQSSGAFGIECNPTASLSASTKNKPLPPHPTTSYDHSNLSHRSFSSLNLLSYPLPRVEHSWPSHRQDSGLLHITIYPQPGRYLYRTTLVNLHNRTACVTPVAITLYTAARFFLFEHPHNFCCSDPKHPGL